jgi:colanic acid biosynthesis glycosyl transferase WcaI
MKSKKITIITANFYPEETAIGLYTSQFAKYLKNNDIEITVLTGFPYYPIWEIPAEYKKKQSFFEENYEGIRIIRFKQFVPSKVNFKNRIIMILSFTFGLVINSFKINKSDLIICIVPFTLNSVVARVISFFHKSKFWIHIQDFEFDLLIDSGIGSKKSIFLRAFVSFLHKTERVILNSADIVSSISSSMISKIHEKSTAKDVFFFPNWVSLKTIDSTNYTQHKYFDSTKFSLLYSGNIGEKQDWNYFIEFCSLIKKEDNIEIIIVGNGGYYSNLIEKSTKFSFVKFKDLVPYDELSDLLCSADAHFLFQKCEVVDSVMPSKLLGMMASSKPSIITGNEKSEVNTIITNSNAGYYLFLNNPQEAYNCVIKVKNDNKNAIKMGYDAKKYVEKFYSEESVLNTTLLKIKSLLDEK